MGAGSLQRTDMRLHGREIEQVHPTTRNRSMLSLINTMGCALTILKYYGMVTVQSMSKRMQCLNTVLADRAQRTVLDDGITHYFAAV